MKPGHSTPAPDDVCECGKMYKDHHHGFGGSWCDMDANDNVFRLPSPAPGGAQHNSVKDMQDVFPGKQPEAISTNTAGVAATSDDAVNFDGSPVTVTDRIIPFNQILANRPEWDEKQRPVSGVAATTAKSTLSVFQQIEHEAESTGNELFDAWREKDERAHYVMGFKDGGRFASKLFDSPTEREGELAALKALLAELEKDNLRLRGDIELLGG